MSYSHHIYNGNQPYIFISYAHKDTDKVLPIISALHANGFRVWYDAGIEAGTEWPETIAEHLMNATSVIAFVSKHSLESQNCRREINFAIELHLEPLVIYLEEVQLSPGMRMQLGTLQAMFYQRHIGQETFLNELFSATLLKACKVEKQMVTPDAVPTIPQLDPKAMQAAECFDEAERYRLGNGSQKDPVMAAQWYRHAADKGHTAAMYQLYLCYDTGIGVAKNQQNALHWLEMAARYGYIPALESIVSYYQIRFKDPAKCKQWQIKLIQSYRSAAVKGESAYFLLLAEAYAKGSGVTKDDKTALEWYLKAANSGNRKAQYIAAQWYLDGKGTKKNSQKAVALLQDAAEHGYVEAQRMLAKFYQYGECGLTKDYLKAAELYRKAGKTTEERWCLELYRSGIK